ncbi:MAG: hypothetical protein ACFBRM_01185 [Pikeienuella sp.]
MRSITKLTGKALLATALLAGSEWAGPQIEAERRAAYSAACKTYENRARFLSRNGAVDFLVLMAEGCRAAQDTLAQGSRVERQVAEAYLERLVLLRDTVKQINMDRVYGRGADRFARPLQGAGQMRPLSTVSKSGEFLIAHRMGLIKAFRTWRAKTEAVALALGSRAPLARAPQSP